LLTLLAILLPCRSHFYRKASLFGQVFTPAWITSIAVVFLSSIWLGLFSHKHTEYSGELWWQFTLLGHASRFLRATVGASCLALLSWQPECYDLPLRIPRFPPVKIIEQAHAVIEGAPKAYAHLALVGDKRLLFSESRKAFVMYGSRGEVGLCSGIL